MIRKFILLRSLAIFMAMEMLITIIVPTFSLALTSGPTAPEATSFEPVDTTDMVNLITGDFVYNLPLLEVPGPGGGYPLSLSYHAGIKLDQDASWVGLGWTLNPGAINRSVNGFADDNQNVSDIDRSFWEGGVSKQFEIGIRAGQGAFASVSAGLIFADDTYRGSGIGYYYGGELEERIGLGPFSLSNSMDYEIGVSPYGDRYSSLGLSMGIGKASKLGINAGAQVGVSVNQDGKAVGSFSMSVNNLDAHMSTAGGSAVSVGGFAAKVHNGRSGEISTSGYNYSAKIPLGSFSLRLSKSYQRYWIDETASVSTNGALYFPESGLPSSSQLDSKAFDVYDLQYPDPGSPIPPDETVAGAFIDYDSYSVVAQGLAGAIRPYHYKSYLVRQNKLEGSAYRVKSYPLYTNPKPHFRFIGDFSNRYEHDINANAFVSNSTDPLSFVFDGNRTTGRNGNEGFDEILNILPGSKHVEWFTNTQINDNERTDGYGQPIPAGPDAAVHKRFINSKALGFTREDNSQIGGFMVINETGMTYHYALPVYSFDEHQYTGRVDEAGKHQFNALKKPHKYAYTWLLTAVTGPDFVDTNLNGYADGADFGHWVNFQYGLWSNSYSWRNPASGFNKDVDHSFDTFSKGKKQVYYLNAIATKTHTAFFVKELRADGKGVVHKTLEAINTGVDHNVTGIDDGSFQPVQKTLGGNTVTEYPVSTLRLHSIYLIQNKDLISDPIPNLAPTGNVYYHLPVGANPAGMYTQADFVLDVHDIANDPYQTTFQTKCLRKIVFNSDYSLCPETPNSYWSELDVLNTSQSTTGTQGKLTLNSLKVCGRGGVDLLPEVKFKYDNPVTFHASVSEGLSSLDMYRLKVIGDLTSLNFRRGDIVRCEFPTGVAYAYVNEIVESQNEIVVRIYLGQTHAVDSHPWLQVQRTKNVPYFQDAYDLWGNFKVDVATSSGTGIVQTENVRRMTTSVSSQSVDVWSLREIQTALGASIKIEYESDTYRSALKSLSNIPIKNVELTSNGKTKIFLHENVAEYGLEENDDVNVWLMSAKRYDVVDPDFFDELRFLCNGVKSTYMYQWYFDNTWENFTIGIESIQGNSFIINHNFTNKYPSLTDGSTCLAENPPYQEDAYPRLDCIPLNQLTASEPIFLGGEVVSNPIFSPYGGDLRVKKLSLEQWSQKRATSYEYINGITPYEPLGLSIPVARIDANLSSCLVAKQIEAFSNFRDASFDNIYSKFQSLFSNARELPGPGVLYEWIRVTESIERPEGVTVVEGKTEFQFEVFSPETINLSTPGGVFQPNSLYSRIGSLSSYGGTTLQNDDFTDNQVLGLPLARVKTTNQSNKPMIKDFTAIMGSLKRIIYYDNSNRKISETINHYLHDDFSENNYLNALQEYDNQGVIAESFADARIIRDDELNAYTLHGIVSQRIKYPSIQTSQTSINYKSGIANKSFNLTFDFYSGQPVKVSQNDGYGNVFISETTPAYHKYPDMGFAYQGHRNMLEQSAGSLNYKLGDNGTKSIVSATALTWSKTIPIVLDAFSIEASTSNHDVWRKHSTYGWKGDDAELVQGLYPETTFSEFNFNNPASNSPQWQRLSEVSLSDKNSNVLQAVDVNGNYASTWMSSDQVFVFASASNAGYYDFACSGAEDILTSGKFGGNASAESTQVIEDASYAHTGYSALRLQPNSVGFTFEVLKENLKTSCQQYHASVWVKEVAANTLPTVALIAETNGGQVVATASPIEKHQADGWYLIQLDFELPTTTNLIRVFVKNISSTEVHYVDDFRVHPQNATVTGYVYNNFGDLSYILDNNNLYTEFRYDGVGRLESVHRESFQYGIKKLSKTVYHHQEE